MSTFLVRAALAGSLLLLAELTGSVRALERLEPPEGCYLGFNFGSGETIAHLDSTLGISPAVFGRFFDLPLSATERGNLTNFLNEVLSSGAMAMVTLEPKEGLDIVSPAVCADIGGLCAIYEALGI